MALTKLGSGSEDGMQLLAGFAGNEDGGGRQGGSGAFGLTALALEKIARVAQNIVTTGSAAGGNQGATPPGGEGTQEEN